MKPTHSIHEAPPTIKPLNPRQAKFAQLVASGTPATKAYVQAGYKANPEKNATQIAGNRGVAARIKALRDEAEAKSKATTLLTIEEKRKLLSEMARDKKAPVPHRVQALALDSKLANHFAPDELIVDAGPVTLDSIREIAARARVVSPLIAERFINAKSHPQRN